MDFDLEVHGDDQGFAPRIETETQTPQTDVSSSDPENVSTTKKSQKSRARVKKERKAHHAAQSSNPSLRPAKDILARIRYDPALEESDFVIGYLDRHLPQPVEMDVSDWKGGGDITEEDWIPQHRILYFRKKGEEQGRRVWDREKRLDRLFGSGMPENEGAKQEQLDRQTTPEKESTRVSRRSSRESSRG